MYENHIVGISDCKASNNADDVIVTYALGSCIGAALYDDKAKVGGLLHFLLPDSYYSSKRHGNNPHMYADTGLQSLLNMLISLGASRERLKAKLVGGANMLKNSGLLDIGKRNAEAALDLLNKENIPIAASSIGGSVGRSMWLNLQDGSVRVRLLGRGEELL